ncbi:hypothetical protein TYRP_002636 [Tyrophagus putrescentiae]|nr:hypothetical protein TYRP_002636 [Tyrophagus putrescentiae]
MQNCNQKERPIGGQVQVAVGVGGANRQVGAGAQLQLKGLRTGGVGRIGGQRLTAIDHVQVLPRGDQLEEDAVEGGVDQLEVHVAAAVDAAGAAGAGQVLRVGVLHVFVVVNLPLISRFIIIIIINRNNRNNLPWPFVPTKPLALAAAQADAGAVEKLDVETNRLRPAGEQLTRLSGAQTAQLPAAARLQRHQRAGAVVGVPDQAEVGSVAAAGGCAVGRLHCGGGAEGPVLALEGADAPAVALCLVLQLEGLVLGDVILIGRQVYA